MFITRITSALLTWRQAGYRLLNALSTDFDCTLVLVVALLKRRDAIEYVSNIVALSLLRHS